RDNSRPRHLRNCQRRQNARAAISPAVQNHLTVDSEIIGGGKQSRVTGNTVHAIRRWIVYFATQPNLTFRTGVGAAIAQIIHLPTTFFRRRDSGPQRWAGTKAGVGHAQWSEDVLLRELIERHSTNSCNNLAERNETNVAVAETSAGWIAKRLVDESLDY